MKTQPFNGRHQKAFTLMEKAFVLLSSNFLKLIYSTSGIMFLYLIVTKFTNNKTFKLKNYVINASSLCYGVYVFHQFILIYLYYHTDFPKYFGSYLLPWFGFVVTIIISILLTKITLKTKIGRFLIG